MQGIKREADMGRKIAKEGRHPQKSMVHFKVNLVFFQALLSINIVAQKHHKTK